MILRQVIVRHGRTAISASARVSRGSRWYATDINIDNPIHRQSERDYQPRQPVPGHPDDPSSILDAVGHQGTPATAPLQAAVDSSAQTNRDLESQINAFIAAQHGGSVPVEKQQRIQTYEEMQSQLPPAPYASHEAMLDSWQAFNHLTHHGSHMHNEYRPWHLVTHPPSPEQVTLPMLLANQCHLGHATALWHPGNSSYIFGIRDGIHIISLEITMSYLRRAAKVVQEVARRGGIILFIGTRKPMRDVVVAAARRAKGYHIFSRWIPGSLTNGQQILGKCAVSVVNAKDEKLDRFDKALKQSTSRPALRPDLVVCLNVPENEVCLHECGLYNVPTIGIVDTDVNPTWVTYPIPANDDSPRSVGLVAGVLSSAAERGQQERYAEAERGRTTYDTRAVERYLQGMEELERVSADVNVSEKSGQDRKEKDDD